jgi:hypothetical protein
LWSVEENRQRQLQNEMRRLSTAAAKYAPPVEMAASAAADDGRWAKQKEMPRHLPSSVDFDVEGF